ncbi:lipopolysaccharide biosynthesis protein [Serratia fonticola]|uniref:lipopolysaccharide biosynthesis protein n=1 Tax=Serratia fonticola TaxID=47917 RepID=UPI00217998B9|nr:oligosaccharide flippase family protein [Serratia fonticola]CAI1052114.1 Polysaccharide biosynthesis protein [Serratia fonticola]
MRKRKVFLKNFVSLNTINLLGSFVPLIVLPFLSKGLTSLEFSLYIVSTIIFSFASSVIDYSFNILSTKEACAIEKNMYGRLIGRVQGARLILSVMASFIIFLYFLFFSVSSDVFTKLVLASFVSLSCIFYALAPSWFFHAMGELSKLTIWTLVGKFLFLLIIVLLPHGNNLLLYAVSAFAMSWFFPAVYSFYEIKRKGIILEYQVFDSFKEMKSGFSVFISSFIPSFYNSIPIILFSAHSSPLLVNTYGVFSKFSDLANRILTITFRSYYTVIIDAQDQLRRKVIIYSTMLSFFAALLLYFCCPFIISILFENNKFESEGVILVLLSVGVFLNGVSNSLLYAYFLPSGKEKVFTSVSILTSLVGAIIVFYLGDLYALIGVIYGITLTRVLMCFLYIINFKSHSKRMTQR